MATNSPLRPLFSWTARASSSLPVPLAPSSITDTSALATRSIVLATLSISGAAVMIDPSTRAAGAALEPPVLGLDRVQVESARDDQPELVDVDRLPVEIIGAAARSP